MEAAAFSNVNYVPVDRLESSDPETLQVIDKGATNDDCAMLIRDELNNATAPE